MAALVVGGSPCPRSENVENCGNQIVNSPRSPAGSSSSAGFRKRARLPSPSDETNTAPKKLLKLGQLLSTRKKRGASSLVEGAESVKKRKPERASPLLKDSDLTARSRVANIMRNQKSMVHNIMHRQLGSSHGMVKRGSFRLQPSLNQKTFGFKGTFELVSTLETSEPDDEDAVKLSFLLRQSPVIEIVAARNVIFGLTQTGLCAAFDRRENRKICFLNVAPDEVIRSLFYNKINDAIITVSVYKCDGYSSLQCRSTSLKCVKRGESQHGYALFPSEVLRWPGFVEFDDVNSKVLTFSAVDEVYKIWDLANYTLLYEIKNRGIQEIKISPGIMLIIHEHRVQEAESGESFAVAPLKVLDVETGTTLKDFYRPLKQAGGVTKQLEFIEQFNEKLLMKQSGEDLEIFDIRTDCSVTVPGTDFVAPSAFIFLHNNQLFLTFKGREISVWNFRGEQVTTFADHRLMIPNCNTNNIYINTTQDILLSYCTRNLASEDDMNGQLHGSINVSDILTGASLAKVVPSKEEVAEGNESVRIKRRTDILDHVSSLYFNEVDHEIYTGGMDGSIYIWSN